MTRPRSESSLAGLAKGQAGWRVEQVQFPAVDEDGVRCALLDAANAQRVTVRDTRTGDVVYVVDLSEHGLSHVHGLHLRSRDVPRLWVVGVADGRGTLLEFDLRRSSTTVLFSEAVTLASCVPTRYGTHLCVVYRDASGSHVAVIESGVSVTLRPRFSTMLLVTAAQLDDDLRRVAFSARSPRTLLEQRSFLLELDPCGSRAQVRTLDVGQGNTRVSGWRNPREVYLQGDASGHDNLYVYDVDTDVATCVDRRDADLSCFACNAVDDVVLCYVDGEDTLVVIVPGDDASRAVMRRVHGTIHWVAHAGPRLVAFASDALVAPHMRALDLESSGPRRAGHVRRHFARSPAGDVPYYLVRGDRPDGRVFLALKGGPGDFWSNEHDFIVATAIQLGCTAVLPNPRGSGGHGRRYRQALVGRWGEVDVDDVASVLDAISEDSVAPADVVVFGHSYGAYLALMCAAHPRFADVTFVAWAGFTDLAHAFDTYPNVTYYLNSHLGDVAASRARWAERSPVSRAPATGARVVLLHGQEDVVVPVEESRRLRAAWGARVELVELPGLGHAATTADQRRDVENVVRHALERGGRNG